MRCGEIFNIKVIENIFTCVRLLKTSPVALSAEITTYVTQCKHTGYLSDDECVRCKVPDALDDGEYLLKSGTRWKCLVRVHE